MFILKTGTEGETMKNHNLLNSKPFRLGLIILIGYTLSACSSKLTAEDVLSNYADAVGGKENLLNQGTRITRGVFSVPDMGLEGDFVVYLKPPDFSMREISIANMKVLSGVHENIAWDMNPMMGDRILRGGELRAAIRNSSWDPVIEWERFYDEVFLDEPEDGEDTFKITLRSNTAKSQAMAYFDQKTFLLEKLISFDDETRSTSWFKNYEDVGGFLLPHQIKMDLGGQITVEMKIDSIEHGKEIPLETFDRPEVIEKQVNE
jgi:hypothetical protein